LRGLSKKKLNRRKTTMKLRNILITVVATGMMFASADRTGVVGYSSGDYDDMNTFAHTVAGQNVAWTTGDNFNAVWTADGTTWGFQGGNNQDLVNMWWSNGTYGLNIGLEMTPEVGTVASETNFDIGFGMGLFGMDVGFGMNTGTSDMSLNLRRACGFWAFDTFTFGYDSYGAGEGTVGTSAEYAAYTDMNFGMYGTHQWGPATGMFGLGFTVGGDTQAEMWAGADDVAADSMNCGDNSDAACNDAVAEGDWMGWEASNADGYTAINTNFSVESTLTDWCDLRIGYTKSFNMADNSVTDSYGVGLGFNYGSVGLDMTLTDGVLGTMMSNPLHYVNGRNEEGLTSSWTLTYNW
jgi:hypothetical protein